MSDSVALQKGKNYVNVREYIKQAKKKWGMKREEAKAEWERMLSDPAIPKSKDQQNWLTMPALEKFKWVSQFEPVKDKDIFNFKNLIQESKS